MSDTRPERSALAMGILPRLLLVSVFLGVAGGGVVLAKERLVPDEGALPRGLKVDGDPIPAGADLRAVVEARVALLRQRRVRLVLLGGASDGVSDRTLREATLAELGVSVDVERTVARIEALGRGDMMTRIDTHERAARGEI